MPRSKNKKEPPTLPAGCGYMGHEFGARYLDSQCFGGQLYDLDNGDGGLLYEPGEYLPCPNCRMEEWLEREAKDVGSGIHGISGRSSLPLWKMICRHALQTNRDEALKLLDGRFKTVTYVELNDDRSNFVDRQWTFDEVCSPLLQRIEELMAEVERWRSGNYRIQECGEVECGGMLLNDGTCDTCGK